MLCNMTYKTLAQMFFPTSLPAKNQKLSRRIYLLPPSFPPSFSFKRQSWKRGDERFQSCKIQAKCSSPSCVCVCVCEIGCASLEKKWDVPRLSFSMFIGEKSFRFWVTNKKTLRGGIWQLAHKHSHTHTHIPTHTFPHTHIQTQPEFDQWADCIKYI